MSLLDVKKIRIDLGLNQQEFADLIGYSKSSVQKWEKGERKPDEKAIYKIRKHTKDHNVSSVEIISDVNIDVLENKNGNKYYINEDGIIQIEVINIPFPAYASYTEVFNDEVQLLEEFGTALFYVDKIGKGYYMAFDVKGDSMNGGGINDTPDKAKVLAREIGRHLWNGSFRQEQYGYILMTDTNIYHKDITGYNEDTGEITLSSRNEMCPDFTIKINSLNRLFNVIKRAF